MSEPVGDCLSESELLQYHAGELGKEEARLVESHLGLCEACLALDTKLVADHEDLFNRVGGLEPDSDGSSTHAQQSPGLSSIRIEGYTLLREIQHGGQGVVYLAVQRSTKRKVAIKVLRDGPYATRAAMKRFEREIELVAQLKHPHIISVFHSGQTEDGRQFYVMDYVRGVSLNVFVTEQRPTLEETLRLFAKVCNAVQYAHQRGVIHRDLKPSNVLVDSAGEPKLLDFGLAKWLAAPVDTVASTSQAAVGTLPYMSPEQARGNPDDIDTRTDIYALGVNLYELLTGHYPYPVVGHMAEVLRHIAETKPTPPSRRWTSDSGVRERSDRKIRAGMCPIDDEVQTVVLKALAKEPARRYQSAGELARDIANYLSGHPIEAKRDSGWYVIRVALRRHKGKAWATAAMVVIVATMSMLLYQQRLRMAEQDDRTRAQMIARKGIELFGRGLWTDAAQEFGRALVIDPDCFHAVGYRAFLRKAEYFAKPAGYSDPTLLQEALADCDQALALKPQAGKAHSLHNLRSIILYSLGRLDDAEAAARECLRLKPDDHFGGSNLAKILAMKGQIDEGIAVAAKAALHTAVLKQTTNDDDGVWLTLATLQLAQDNPAARQSLDQALAIDKRDARTRIMRARAEVLLDGNPAIALEAARYANTYAHQPDARYTRVLAQACLLNDLFEEAEGHAQAAIDRGDEAAFGHLIKAIARARSGNLEGARAALVHAEAAWPAAIRDAGLKVHIEKGLLWFESAAELNGLKDQATQSLADASSTAPIMDGS
jgi:serine/threonine protein kinase